VCATQAGAMPECEKELTESARVELLAYQQFLDGEPTLRLSGEEFLKADTLLVDRVTKWYVDNRVTTVAVPNVGTVSLDRRAVGRSIGHGLNRVKCAAFAAIPFVLASGRVSIRSP